MLMWFPTIPADWTQTNQEIPAVLCFFLHANGSLRALISAKAKKASLSDGAFWNFEHETTLIIKVKPKQSVACSQMFNKFLRAYSWDFSSWGRARLILCKPQQLPLSQTLLRGTGTWGHWALGQSSALKLFNQNNTQATAICWPG